MNIPPFIPAAIVIGVLFVLAPDLFLDAAGEIFQAFGELIALGNS